ncbi:hypothetical protein Tco_1120673 [Tanacetum coccineum]
MTTPTFAATHNLVAFLEKPTESEGFEQIIDFLNAKPYQYALTVNPTVYTSCIKQFWATIKVKKVNVTDYIPNDTIFEELARMGYEKPSQSAKTTAWNEFSSTMASVIICLANTQKFNLLRLRRLRKVGAASRVESSKDTDSLGDQVDSSKQGRNIAEIDQDEKCLLDCETQGEVNNEEMIWSNDLQWSYQSSKAQDNHNCYNCEGSVEWSGGGGSVKRGSADGGSAGGGSAGGGSVKGGSAGGGLAGEGSVEWSGGWFGEASNILKIWAFGGLEP